MTEKKLLGSAQTQNSKSQNENKMFIDFKCTLVLLWTMSIILISAQWSKWTKTVSLWNISSISSKVYPTFEIKTWIFLLAWQHQFHSSTMQSPHISKSIYICYLFIWNILYHS